MTEVQPLATGDVLTAPEAAELLKVDVRTLRQAVARGQIPTIRVGKQVRVSRRVLEALLAGVRA